ncbi:hypothetical protein ACJIZ3_009650 [Penstemon smallii]|uniref:Glutamine-dependent NAD(+) synthetase n=1 Tax=Penstemon smallii TaxID=265156 RepID=A0ABD3TD42_9LAMI
MSDHSFFSRNNLNQWAMDFDSNMNNIKKSISMAKTAGAAIRLGPELEITGYGCEDHFLELDTINHAWECLRELLVGDWTDGILCSFGMPVVKGLERYNCQVLCLNRKIVMIRPKMWLANGGSCAELRWFTSWKQKDPSRLDHFLLPSHISQALSQTMVPFGYGYIQFLDTAVGAEVCMELFSPVSPHAELALNGVEVFMNASGSNHLLGKANRRLATIIGATIKCGGVYMYSNHLGCDGGRVYYDGCSCIVVNGDVVAQGSQFSLKDVDLVVAQVELDVVTSFRDGNSSIREQASCKSIVSAVNVPYKLCQSFKLRNSLSSPLKVRKFTKANMTCKYGIFGISKQTFYVHNGQIEFHSHEEEIGLGAACWLWNQLRRSGASGFLLPLSGCIDSSSVAAIVGCMCQLVVKEIENGNEQVKNDAIRIGHYTDGQVPRDSKEFAKRIFYTVFMGSQDSTCDDTRRRSRELAEEIESWHFDVSVDGVVCAMLSLFQILTGKRPRYQENGGSNVENLALRNIQARIKMVLAYMLASLLPWVHNKPGFYLVLSSSNADEGLSGNVTKYGCSSGDINPIGSINKQDLRAFLRWAVVHLGYSSLAEVEASQSNAESDELHIEMTDEELSVYGKLRRISRYGPNLCYEWGSKLTPAKIADKVKCFFKSYSINRHKMTVLTPSYLMKVSSSADDNRLDLRQFLYNSNWPYQFRKIDELVQQFNGDEEALAECT